MKEKEKEEKEERKKEKEKKTDEDETEAVDDEEKDAGRREGFLIRFVAAVLVDSTSESEER